MTDGPQEFHDLDDIVIVSSCKIASYELMQHARLSILQQLMAEAVADVPNPDWIEVRAIRRDHRPQQEGAPT